MTQDDDTAGTPEHNRPADSAQNETVEDGVRVELEYIGEGWGGDYDEDDPDDEALLRFSVSLVKPDPARPDYPDDASYCTRLPESLGADDRRRIREAILRRVKDDVLAGVSIKRTCEELSWLDESDVARLRAARLEELRQVLRSESMSYGELAELQSLAEHIEAGDVELLEAAGVPETTP